MASGLEEAWSRLTLTEDEEQVIICDEDESEERIEHIALCLWGKLLTDNYFNLGALKAVLKNAYFVPPLKQTMEFAKVLGSQLGVFLNCDEATLYCGVDKSVNFQVELDITKPLRRGIRMVVRGKTLWIRLGYVKLPDLCYGCGKLGHVLKGCDVVGDIDSDVSTLQYGEWLRASETAKARLQLKFEDSGTQTRPYGLPALRREDMMVDEIRAIRMGNEVLTGRGMEYYGLYVDARGRSGGLALLWLKDIEVALLTQSSHHIDVEIGGRDDEPSWRFTGLYEWPETQHKLKICEFLRDQKPRSTLSWLLGGDLSEILYHHKNSRGPPKPDYVLEEFQQTLAECALVDFGYAGSDYTWWNRRDGQASVEERLDRFCGDWVTRFLSFWVTHLDEKLSDHLPITIDTRWVQHGQRRVKRRRFEMMWVNDDRCETVVKDSWASYASSNAVENCITKVDRCLSLLQRWNWSEFDDVHKAISHCKERLKRAVRVQEHEEVLWWQRSHVDFLRFGDKNINNISELKGDDGILYGDTQNIENIVVRYFDELFTSPVSLKGEEIISLIPTKVSACMRDRLERPYTREEVVTPHNPQFSFLRVGDLIDSEHETWREDLVKAVFLPVDATVILGIPLSIHLPPDRVVWHYSSCGELTIRKRAKEARCSGVGDKSGWKAIWGLNVPPRIKFAGALPTASRLSRRIQSISMRCNVYGAAEDMDIHALFECPLALSIWEVTWSVCGARNKYLFENKLIIAGRVWRKAINFLHDYQRSRDREKNSSAQEVTGWRRPDAGFCKLNFDAAKLGDWGYGWGVLVRDSEGNILLSIVSQGMGFLDPKLEEARACIFAIQTAQ
ncbi:LOW QUALITY PROTEIN: hypothetical protein Cgig2_028580 [Carnegiea gigantea]|uniref:CCHC-type domain-containing protein n=1 Tax=Carnegiea gigantea TaxID=171969 RepID=A0A9Q1K3T6_9CARY|nr:LOW QUALITY PROTEIN: hypothetical protein Cgig2_028580 [Carnegiea gigantea]